MSKIHKYRSEWNNDNLSFENSGWSENRTEKNATNSFNKTFKNHTTQKMNVQ